MRVISLYFGRVTSLSSRGVASPLYFENRIFAYIIYIEQTMHYLFLNKNKKSNYIHVEEQNKH